MAAIAAATIGSFLSFGLPLLRKAAGTNLHQDVDSISRELKYIHAFCKGIPRSGVATSEVLDLYLKEMELLAYDMEDFTDCFLSNFWPRGREASGSFPRRAWRFAIRKMIPSSIQIGQKIHEFNKRSSVASEWLKIYADTIKQTQIINKKEPTPPAEVASSFNMEGASQKLLQLVTKEPSESEKQLKVISIVGYGAQGNTLLVDMVYNTNEVCNQFPVRARVNAKGKIPGKVLDDICEQVPQSQNGASTPNIDDHQNQNGVSTSNIDHHQNPNGASTSNIHDHQNPNGASTSNIGHHQNPNGVSTFNIDHHQNQNGASTSNIHDHKGKGVKELQETKSTPCIVDGNGKDVIEPQKIESTSLAIPLRSCQRDRRYLIVIDNVDMDKLDIIIKHCVNEDYGILIIATTDYTETIHCKCSSHDLNCTTAQYMEIGELKSTIDKKETGRLERKLQDVLVSNYDKSLSSLDFEQCLLYFCMFPHDHLVRWNLLIMRYLAEGIVFSQQNTQGKGKFCSPQKCLKILIDHNVVQPIQVSKNGDVKRCQPHVMMLNHIYGESKSKNFFTLICGSSATHGFDPDEKNPVRRLSVHPITAEDDRLSLPDANNLSRLRTLAVFHTGNLDKIEELSKYELLRVLDLKKCVVLTREHVKKICDLLLLKYLSLGDSIDVVPREIAQLQWLETLDMTKTRIVSVHLEVMELPRLKHLLGKFQLYRGEITENKMKELSSTKSKLERLSGFVIGDSKEFQQLMSRMKMLRKVKIWCAAKKWTDDDDSLSIAIKMFNMKTHSLSLDDQKKGSLSIDCKVCPTKILESLQDPGTLTSLKLHGDLKQFLHFHVNPMVGTELTGIEELCLSGTNLRGDEIVRVVTLFRALTYLKLVEDNLGPFEIPPNCLHSLKRLCLVGVHTLHGIKIQAGAPVCLVSLHMLFKTPGDQVQTQCDLSGIHIRTLKNLEEIALYSGVAQDIKEGWQAQASRHDKKPKIVFLQSPEHSAT